MSNVLQYFTRISTFVFDIDGVLTDGTVLVLDNGLQARRMSIKDGLALQMAIKYRYRVLIVSGGHSPQVQDRLAKLGVSEVHLSVMDKRKFVEEYIQQHGIQREEVLFMGDDLPDVPVLEAVGLSCCPADAVDEVKQVSKYISHVNGGMGCARDVIEKVLRLNGHWVYSTDVSSR